MAIYTIADLHLSFGQNKPMNIFGDNWENHERKIEQNWKDKVSQEDYVILSGDFSWATYLEDAKKDFEYLNNLPGNKILLKGNHDYWWNTLTNMRKFLHGNNYVNIDFLYNNSYCIENKVIVGTRGWNILDKENDSKMIKREKARLMLSINDAIEKYGNDKEKVAFFHYPPISIYNRDNGQDNDFVKILKEYNIKKCYYGHLHGNSHKDAVIGEVDGIFYKLISADYLDFNLFEI